MKLEDILKAVYRRGLQRTMGKETLSIDQTIKSIRQWALEQIPKESKDDDVVYGDGFNDCRNLIIEKFEEKK